MLSQAVAVEYREQRTRVNSVAAMVLAVVTVDNCHQVLSPAVAAEHREQRSLLNATLSCSGWLSLLLSLVLLL